jgi:hypothetical protein
MKKNTEKYVYEKIKFSLTEIFEKKQEEDEAAVLNQEKKK